MRLTVFNLSLIKKIGLLSLPVMLSNLLQTIIPAVDIFMIGQLGPIAISAVGLGNTLRLFVLVLLFSVSGGAISLIAQAKGSRDQRRMSFVARQALVAGLLFSIFLGALGYFLASPLLNLMDQSGETTAVALGVDYLHVLFLGTPFIVLNIVANKLMQGAGDMITPLYLTIATVILNIGFNYIFIFGIGPIPAFGVIGAAIGTIIARGILLLVALYLFFSGKNVVQILEGSWRPNKELIRDIMEIGVPSGIQGVFRQGSNLIIIGIVTATSLGTYGAAVLAIGMQVEQLIAQPIVGMNVAATTIIGQDLGRWQTQQAYEKGILITIMGIISMSLLILPVYLFSEQFIALFDPSGHPKIMMGGTSYFKYTLLALAFSAIGIVVTGTLRGAGDTKPAMYSAIINRNIFQLGVGYWLAFPMGMSYEGVWLGIVAGRLLDALTMSTIWIKQHWVNVALQKTDIYRTHLKDLSPKNLKKYLAEIRTPLMEQRGTLEKVNDREVIYEKEGKRRVIQFDGDGYRVAGSKGLLTFVN
ncbi:MAG: MATE family efflux transporter [Bacteroidota bacterium]